jgi:hypothetical protein
MASDDKSEKDYEASCQCGQVAYKVKMAPVESQPITTCDCSICTRNGYALAYVPRENVTWIQGYDMLKIFRFASKRLDHKFCPECGSSMLIDPNFSYSKLEKMKGAPDILCLNVSPVALPVY